MIILHTLNYHIPFPFMSFKQHICMSIGKNNMMMGENLKSYGFCLTLYPYTRGWLLNLKWPTYVNVCTYTQWFFWFKNITSKQMGIFMTWVFLVLSLKFHVSQWIEYLDSSPIAIITFQESHGMVLRNNPGSFFFNLNISIFSNWI